MVPVLNKLDMPAARPAEVAQELHEAFDIDPQECIGVSAKTGVRGGEGGGWSVYMFDMQYTPILTLFLHNTPILTRTPIKAWSIPQPPTPSHRVGCGYTLPRHHRPHRPTHRSTPQRPPQAAVV